MDNLRGDLGRLRDRQRPEPDAFDRLARRRRALHLRRRLGAGILAILIAGAGLGALMRAFDGNGTKPATSPSLALSIGGGDSITVKMVAPGKAMVDTQRAIYTLGGSTDPTTWRKAAHVGMNGARPATFQLIDGSWDGWQLWRPRSGSAVTVRYSRDQGSRWAQLSVIGSYRRSLSLSATFSFIDLFHGWAVVQAVDTAPVAGEDVYHTNDGGRTWKLLGHPYLIQPSAVFVSPRRGWAIGDAAYGSLYTTTDGGVGWTKVHLPEAPVCAGGKVQQLATPVFIDPLHGFIQGEVTGETCDSPVYYVTADGGQTWSAVAGPDTQHGVATAFVTPTTWYATIDGGLDATTDAGKTWRPIATNIDLTNASSLSFVDPENGIVGVAGVGAFVTADGGRNWVSQQLP